MVGAVANVAIGAGIKLGVNVVNQFLAQKREERQMLHARDAQQLQAHQQFVSEQAKDPFVKATRRMLFFMLTGTYCFLLIYYALRPDIEYQVLVPRSGGEGSILAWILGSSPKVNVEPITLSGGLLLWQFQHVIQLIIGFYCVPSKAR